MRKQKVSWKDTWRWNYKSYRYLFHKYPKMFLSRLLSNVWDSVTPYVTIYLSARVIANLTESVPRDTLVQSVIVLLISSFVIGLVSILFKRWKSIEGDCISTKIRFLLTHKLTELDYSDYENADIYGIYQNIVQYEMGPGFGFCRVYKDFENLISSIFVLLGGISLTVSLFVIPVPDSASVWGILNHPLFIFLVIILFLVVSLLPSFCVTKAESYFLSADDHTLANRLFSFYGFLGFNDEYAGNMRIYRQDQICEKYNRDNTGAFGSQGKNAKLSRGIVGVWYVLSTFFEVLLTGIVYLFVCFKSLAGAFGVGAVTQYIGAITKFSGGLSLFSSTLGSMRNNTPFLKIVFSLLDRKTTTYIGTRKLDPNRFSSYQLEFRDVSFRYPGADTYALQHVSLQVPIGKKIAIVGPNGSGKTTFIKLLCRLYEPTEGEILLNGINIKEYDYQDYLACLSVIFQDFSLFAYTVGENITFSHQYASEKVMKSLHKAHLYKEFPNGLDTYLSQKFDGSGVSTSGGEEQKLAIARAIYKDSPLMILDEPTASLDPLSEAEIYENFNEISNHKTTIYISHRLSSCHFCDVIVVFQEGKIVQVGRHSELLQETDGMYAKLWHAQAQYYTKEVTE